MLELGNLENRSLYMLREAYAEFNRPAVLWSTGKDSTATLWLCRKAFFGKIPFPVIHIDTTYKFQQMYEFRDRLAKEWGMDMVIARNDEALAQGVGPKDGKFECCTRLKTEALMKCLQENGFDALILAIRRDEHGIRAKERYFSPRDEQFRWNYKDQPLEMWDQYQSITEDRTHIRVHPILHWRELDVWEYVQQENIPVNPMYFAKNGYRYRCFSEDTRLLTSDGLKGPHEINSDTEFATLNKEGFLEYQKPINIFNYDYDGELIHIYNRSLDLLVTPNHSLYFRRRFTEYHRNRPKRLGLVNKDRANLELVISLRAKGYNHQDIADIIGVSRPTITRWCNQTITPRYVSLPLHDGYRFGRAVDVLRQFDYESIEFKRNCRWKGLPINDSTKNFPQFMGYPVRPLLNILGWYLAEGTVNNYQIIICQSTSDEYRALIRKDFEELGFAPHIRDDRIWVNASPLATFLHRLGLSHTKYIPKLIKQLPPDLLFEMFDRLIKGDGSFVDGKPKKYTTVSWQLANDVLEIGLKLGLSVTLMKDRETWCIWFSGEKHETPRLSVEPEMVDYRGKIWDVEVPNHVIMAERNGRLCWTGNSLGCEPCTLPIDSNAQTIDEIVEELKGTKIAERSGRAQDKEKAFTMQKLRALGYM